MFFVGEIMNLCILLGKVVSRIEFKFIINSKNKSIVYFYVQLLNKSIIRVNAYNERADYIYRKLKKGQNIIIKGKIRKEQIVECENIKILNR